MTNYLVLAGRIRQELTDLEHVVSRTERALAAAQQYPENRDLFFDSAALNLHDFYSGLERTFQQIASTVDQSRPAGSDWHRELLRQMNLALPALRPPILSSETLKMIDEYLRFRHVVRNIYTFEFDPARIKELVQNLRPAFERVKAELLAFATFLDQLAQAG